MTEIQIPPQLAPQQIVVPTTEGDVTITLPVPWGDYDLWGPKLNTALATAVEAFKHVAGASDASVAGFIEDADSQTRAAVQALVGTSGGITPDPGDPYFFTVPSGSSLSPDPGDPYFFTIGA